MTRDQKVNLLFAAKQESSRCAYYGRDMKLYHGEYDEKKNDLRLDEQLSRNALTLLGDPGIKDEEYGTFRPMVGSHRGLVCFHATHNKIHNNVQDSVYICNPFTQETILLPQPPSDFYGGFVVSGFGYLYSTNEYKVVRIHYGSRPSDSGQVHVYTLGDKIGWRTKDEIKYYPLSKGSNGVLYDGALHWIDYHGTKIVAFDLADEKFRTAPILLPPCFPDYYGYQLMMLGGYLSIVFMKSFQTDIYSLKETENKRGGKVWKWSKEFTINSTQDLKLSPCYPISITGEDKLLMFKGNAKSWLLCCYDAKTGTLEEFVDDKMFKEFQLIPYVKSDVSLTVLAPDLKLLPWVQKIKN